MNSTLPPAQNFSRCDPFQTPQVPYSLLANYTPGTDYCSINFPVPLGGFSECCNTTDVRTYNNCTQYCATTVDMPLFSACVSSAARFASNGTARNAILCGTASSGASDAAPILGGGKQGLLSLAMLGLLATGFGLM
ncbi:hypothetical protein BDZ85DRAFT_120284 [Elsinoe ampelina]|uniref:Uncharacterized protein n=1 Tax=Elsinoe ampelina TaxID=302913 RepID=A0A6A6GB93_9PEZI|nr:hypothetical protein BDZ85DRAFT_120284 [Elsinoe ampelina]